MRKHLNKLTGFVASTFFLVAPLVIGAAEEDHEGHGGHAGGSPQELIFPVINFLLFVFVLRKYVLPAVREALRKRRDTIVRALNEAKKAKDEAQALRQEYEQKLAGLAAEQERLRQQALVDAEHEKQRILEEARNMAERARREVQQTAQREVAEARRILQQEVAEQAVRLATELVRARLTPNDQGRLIQDLVQEVQKNVGNTALR